jgi:tungstate transport system substrate-binding protein
MRRLPTLVEFCSGGLTTPSFRPGQAVHIARWIMLAALLPLAIGAGCSGERDAVRPVRMATTTSTANSGLLDHLLPEFTKDTGIRVDFIPTGTGMALAHGRNGDVDLVLVHAPAAEEAFVSAGYGVARIPVMWNDFVIAGPKGDPAGLGTATSAVEAFTRIANTKALFISRGDDSGTHRKELALWKQASHAPTGGAPAASKPTSAEPAASAPAGAAPAASEPTSAAPAGEWYIEAGQGMGACLAMAHEKLAYVLTDRGTYLAMADKFELDVIYEGDAQLRNPYSMIAIDRERYPDLNHAGAQALIEWMLSARARELIAGFQVGGRPLFHLFEAS